MVQRILKDDITDDIQWLNEVLLWRENHASGAYPPLKFPRLVAGITSGDYTDPNLVIPAKVSPLSSRDYKRGLHKP